jgi:hypothetical protein
MNVLLVSNLWRRKISFHAKPLGPAMVSIPYFFNGIVLVLILLLIYC